MADDAVMATTQYVSLNELADALNLPARWLRDEAANARIPFILVGKRRRFDAELVRAELRRRSHGGAIIFVEAGDGGAYRIITTDDLRGGPSDA